MSDDNGSHNGGADDGWAGEVEHSADGYSLVPDEILCPDEASAAAAEALAEGLGRDAEVVPIGDEFLVRSTAFDVEAHVAELRDRGVPVEPNYALFAHGHHCSCGCCGSPVAGNPMYANPMYANPVYANPVWLSPVYASPMYANPMYANEYKRTGKRSHSARPAAPPDLKPAALPQSNETVLILDTGIAPDGQLPPLLQGQSNLTGAPASEHDPPPPAAQGYLDPANCHGTFIAGIIQELAPDRNPVPRAVLGPMGDGKLSVIGPLLKDLAKDDKLVNERTVLNLSFGGYADPDMKLLKRGIRKVQEKGAVVVASAGNDGTCRPMFPAALPDVISVGALAWDGPAPFSNHGDWVRACAPGSDLVSAFYTLYNGQLPARPLPGSGDPDEFKEWARWSGTSFAAPIVTAALLRTMALTGCTAKEAVLAVIDAPGLHRMPGLGTVVNLVTPFSAAP